MSRVLEMQRMAETPSQDEQTEGNAHAYMKRLHEAHMKDCDDADAVGGSYMRGDGFPIDEVPLWVVRVLAH